MSVETINARIYLGSDDLSGDSNKVETKHSATPVNVQVFTNTATNFVPGQYDATLKAAGFANLGLLLGHEGMRANIGVRDAAASVAVAGGIVGAYAELTKLMAGSYVIGDEVGAVLPFSIEGRAQGAPWVAGQVFVAAGVKTSSGNSGTAIQLGPVSATQRVYANVHVIGTPAGSSPTLAVTVKSDTAVGFSTPATQLTFATATGKTSEHKSAVGAITDDWWRVDHVIGGTGSPSFNFVVVVGIF